MPPPAPEPPKWEEKWAPIVYGGSENGNARDRAIRRGTREDLLWWAFPMYARRWFAAEMKSMAPSSYNTSKLRQVRDALLKRWARRRKGKNNEGMVKNVVDYATADDSFTFWLKEILLAYTTNGLYNRPKNDASAVRIAAHLMRPAMSATSTSDDHAKSVLSSVRRRIRRHKKEGFADPDLRLRLWN